MTDSGRRTVVLGEEIFYEFTSTEDLHQKPVELELIAYDGWGIDNSWRETQTATRVDGNTYRAPFVVKLHETGKDKELHPPIEIQCKAVGVATESDRLRLDMGQVVLTEEPNLHRIMLHEFHKQEGTDWVFDPTKPQAYIDALTPEQRKVLCTHPIPAGQKARLVVFVTILPMEKRNWILADYAGAKPGQVKGNASFAMFRRAHEQDVELVCYTEHLLVNGLNTSTRTQFEALDKAGELKPDNAEPPRYTLVTGKPGKENSGVPFIRIYGKDGENFMPLNSIHGLINTHGCWMLFRNFNWPVKGSLPSDASVDLPQEFMKLYLRMRFGQKIADDLAKFDGYTFKKFWFDRNYAYFWMLHELAGLRYWGEDDWKRLGGINDYQTHGHSFEPEIPTDYEYEPVKYPDEYPQHVSYPSPAERKDYPDSLWGPNLFGDVTGTWAGKEVYVRGKGRRLENPDCSWADLYLYREGDAELPKIKYGE